MGGSVSTILFVDDHHAVRTVFAETLRSAGHMVLEAGTLADADTCFERQRGAIDLLIVEAVLTTTNGLEIAERLPIGTIRTCGCFVCIRGVRKKLICGRPVAERRAFLQEPFAAEVLIGRLQQLLNAGKVPETGGRARSVESRRASGKSIHPGTARSHH